jgi:hypothetical protein
VDVTRKPLIGLPTVIFDAIAVWESISAGKVEKANMASQRNCWPERREVFLKDMDLLK